MPPLLNTPVITRACRRTPVAAWLLPLMLLAGMHDAAGDPGLVSMDRTVREACACAETRSDGVQAAIACTAPTKRYATQAVEYRDAWTAQQHEVEANLRRLLEYCLTRARSYVQSLDELGLLVDGPGAGIPPPRVLATWYRVVPDELPANRGNLARVRRAGGAMQTGMVQAVDDTELVLRMAREDGGGERRIPLADISAVRVLRFPQIQ